jgi:NAD(P)-dependent dehydrogenase (short-subunit alcohol dehydrogenase family)
MNAHNLSCKLAPVTGAGRGIGRALTLRVAKEGWRVALWEVDTAADEDAADELTRFGAARLFPLDGADRERWVSTVYPKPAAAGESICIR